MNQKGRVTVYPTLLFASHPSSLTRKDSQKVGFFTKNHSSIQLRDYSTSHKQDQSGSTFALRGSKLHKLISVYRIQSVSVAQIYLRSKRTYCNIGHTLKDSMLHRFQQGCLPHRRHSNNSEGEERTLNHETGLQHLNFGGFSRVNDIASKELYI